MAESVAPSAISPRGWVIPSLGVIALVVLGLAYSLYQSYQGVSALEKRVATLEATAVSATTLGTDVSTLKAQITDLGALKTQVAELASQAGDAPKKLEDLETRLVTLEQAAPPAPTDLSGVTADLDALKTNLETLKTQLGDVAPDKLAALKTQIDQVAASIPAVPDTSQLETKVAALDGQIQALRAQIAAPSSAPPPPSVDLAALQGEVNDLAALQGEVNDLKARVAAVDLGPLTSGLGDVKSQVDRLGAQVAELPARSDLAALQARLNEIADAPSSTPPAPPAVDIAPLQADIGDLRSRVAAVEDSGKADDSTIASLRSEFDGLTSRVGTLESANPASDLTALQASLGELKQQIGALASGPDLKALQVAVADLQSQPKPAAPAIQPTLLTQIYFDRGSYQLSEAEMQKLGGLAAQLRDKPRNVAVMGFSDTQGPAEFNRSLSLKRASAVRKALLGFGIGESLITSISGLGEDGPPVPTRDNSVEPGNRTVMIYANE